MIVIFGDQSDHCASHTYEYLRRRGTDVIFIETSHLFTTMGVNLSLARVPDDSFLTVYSHTIPLATISGVLARMRGPITVDPEQTLLDQRYIHDELSATLAGLLNSFDCRVINRPRPWMWHRSVCASAEKVRGITQCGFILPATQVTSSGEAASRFYDRCGRRAILGSPSGQIPWRLITGEEGGGYLRAVLARHPIFVQEVPAGQWVQVFTVGDSVFGASGRIALGTEENGRVPLQAAELTPALHERCYRLAQALHLDFSHIHLLQTEQGDEYCFDLSAFPVYDQCEGHLQERITSALGELLEKGDRRTSDDPAAGRSGRSGDGIRLRVPRLSE